MDFWMGGGIRRCFRVAICWAIRWRRAAAWRRSTCSASSLLPAGSAVPCTCTPAAPPLWPSGGSADSDCCSWFRSRPWFGGEGSGGVLSGGRGTAGAGLADAFVVAVGLQQEVLLEGVGVVDVGGAVGLGGLRGRVVGGGGHGNKNKYGVISSSNLRFKQTHSKQ